MSTLMRGVVTIKVEQAKNLTPRQGLISKAVSKVTKPFSCASDQLGNTGGTYVKIKVGGVKIGQTKGSDKKRHPVWSESFRADLAHETEGITFEIRCEEITGDPVVGYVTLSAEDIMNNPGDQSSWKILSHEGEADREIDWFPLVNTNKELTDGSLNVIIQFRSVPELVKSKYVEDSYFKPQNSCRMTLYQDAHTPNSALFGGISYEDGSSYIPASAWKDLLASINNAKHFIYITGWSVWINTKLVRDEGEESDTLGNILAKKASEGVRVLGLVWDEKTSNIILPGLMGTHDEETVKFFKDKGIDFELVYRKKEIAKEATTQLKSEATQWSYSHHQKCVIVDEEHPDGGDKRRIVAYVGGLDLAKGRYDTPEHPLFSTLQSQHKGDFYQNCVKVNEETGPRQPWHDIHCKVEGSVAVDVLVNFEERWKKQLANKKGKLLDIHGNDIFDVNCPAPCESKEVWECQLLRSITSDSAEFQGEDHGRLTKKANVMCDDSIHRGYVQHIRRAEKYIYIENQYFLGSAYAWLTESKPKAHHVIPFEITNRIIEKIKANERFCVYIVIPMYPEGSPGDKAVQEILFWQKKTFEMMYKRIKAAITECGLDTSPKDYLNLYCLGKREEDIPTDLPEPVKDSVEAKLRQSRRFMVYVHSKMMIVDDEYIIVGSANINQRSMAGCRDTEIAVGGLQPHYIQRDGKLPKGEVHAFRMALWAEHTGLTEDCFQDPSSSECVQKVNELAEANWDIYSGPETLNTNGFLIAYPYKVNEDGSIDPREGFENFPDFGSGAKVCGTESAILPNQLTT